MPSIADPDPRMQSRYQVRFHSGPDVPAALIADCHVVIVADALADKGAEGSPAAVVAAGAPAAVVLGAGLRSRAAAARAVLAEQARLGDRALVAVVAAGRPDGSFAVEDFLAAGAVIDALAALGIDYASPEAAAACAAFTGLERAVGHLLSASVTGQEWLAAGRVDELAAAGALDADAEVTVRIS
jgi:hypothetical protein